MQSEMIVSKHAAKRVQERNIPLTEREWNTIEMKMTEAEKKGVSDAIVMTGENGLLVNTQENTAIIVLEYQEPKEKITKEYK